MADNIVLPDTGKLPDTVDVPDDEITTEDIEPTVRFEQTGPSAGPNMEYAPFSSLPIEIFEQDEEINVTKEQHMAQQRDLLDRQPVDNTPSDKVEFKLTGDLLPEADRSRRPNSVDVGYEYARDTYFKPRAEARTNERKKVQVNAIKKVMDSMAPNIKDRLPVRDTSPSGIMKASEAALSEAIPGYAEKQQALELDKIREDKTKGVFAHNEKELIEKFAVAIEEALPYVNELAKTSNRVFYGGFMNFLEDTLNFTYDAGTFIESTIRDIDPKSSSMMMYKERPTSDGSKMSHIVFGKPNKGEEMLANMVKYLVPYSVMGKALGLAGTGVKGVATRMAAGVPLNQIIMDPDNADVAKLIDTYDLPIIDDLAHYIATGGRGAGRLGSLIFGLVADGAGEAAAAGVSKGFLKAVEIKNKWSRAKTGLDISNRTIKEEEAIKEMFPLAKKTDAYGTESFPLAKKTDAYGTESFKFTNEAPQVNPEFGTKDVLRNENRLPVPETNIIDKTTTFRSEPAANFTKPVDDVQLNYTLNNKYGIDDTVRTIGDWKTKVREIPDTPDNSKMVDDIYQEVKLKMGKTGRVSTLTLDEAEASISKMLVDKEALARKYADANVILSVDDLKVMKDIAKQSGRTVAKLKKDSKELVKSLDKMSEKEKTAYLKMQGQRAILEVLKQ